MVNEIEEFRAYTEFPVYKADSKKDVSYMGRFTLPMLLDFSGFRHILTILARGYLFRADGSAYDRIETARRALLAWCSLSAEKMKKAPDQNDPRLRTDYGEYADEFPELVTPDGEGWLIRHVNNIVAFVEANPDAVRKEAVEKAQALKEGFREQWAKKLRHMLVPPFAPNTKGAWVLRVDDILADALEFGPLKNKDFDLPEDVLQCLDGADAQRCTRGSQRHAVQILCCQQGGRSGIRRPPAAELQRLLRQHRLQPEVGRSTEWESDREEVQRGRVQV